MQRFIAVDGAGLEEALGAPNFDGLVVVYFWGPNCPNCDVFKSQWPELLPLLPAPEEGVRLYSVDAYALTELATRYALYGVPAFLLFHRGKLLGRMSEYRGKEFFSSVVREQLEHVRAGASVKQAPA